MPRLVQSLTVRDWLHSSINGSPALFRMTYCRSRRHQKVLIRSDTDLLVEGFPRSANTFAVWAFRVSNPGVKVAHHMHAAAHVMLAVKQGVPALVLLRDPEAAIRSFLVRRTDVHPRRAIRDYVEFYKRLVGQSDDIVIARFESVIDRFGSVVKSINERHGTSFTDFVSNEERQKVFDAIDDANRKRHGGAIDAKFVPRPHPERDQLKREVSLDGYQVELSEARELYRYFVAKAL